MNAEHRLRKDLDIAKVLKSKKGVFDSACGMKYVKNDKAVSRFAIIVSTKVSKNAVDRNKIRRQYKEILTKVLPSFPAGYDVLLLASKPALALDYQEKEKKFLHVLRKSGLQLA
jgi:ribonuclease P protein component